MKGFGNEVKKIENVLDKITEKEWYFWAIIIGLAGLFLFVWFKITETIF